VVNAEGRGPGRIRKDRGGGLLGRHGWRSVERREVGGDQSS